MHRVPFLPRADVLHLASGALHYTEEIKGSLVPVLGCIRRPKRGAFEIPLSLRNQFEMTGVSAGCRAVDFLELQGVRP